MFPANPWIPYRLERVDLSHNLIPVLTFDITFGTKKLKSLNLSHNAIIDVRKYVVGNLSALEVLDLSNNKLTNLNDPDAPFNLPENITHLYLQNNEIFKMNYTKATSLMNIKEINVENNQLMHLNSSMITAIKSGISVKFAGNPLVCNCGLQSLKHFLLGQEFPPAQYSQLMCSEPKHVSGISLQDVEDRQLTCSEEEKADIEEFNHDYEILPDIRFRDILL
jgi:Leucine-rich repeat (LRR) protein